MITEILVKSWIWINCRKTKATSINDGIPPVDALNGLTEREAQVRLKREGFNELPRADRRTPLRIVLEVLREPMLALLLAAVLYISRSEIFMKL